MSRFWFTEAWLVVFEACFPLWTVSPSGRISVCSGSGVSSAREEPMSSDFALHFTIRLVYGDCLSQPHTFIYLFIYFFFFFFEPNQGQGGIFVATGLV